MYNYHNLKGKTTEYMAERVRRESWMYPLPESDDPLAELYEAMRREEKARADYYKGQTWLEKSGVGVKPEPEAEALAKAEELARAAFAEDPDTLARLERAAELVKAGAVEDLGGGQWKVASQNGGQTYAVNGRCGCPDAVYRGLTYCKHKLATCLIRKARALQNGAEGAATPSAPAAPDRTKAHENDTMTEVPRQIELVVTYETDEATARPRLHNGGELAEYKADGQPMTPPTQDLDELYRWLQAHDYTPAAFQWLGRAAGYKRQRRQTYILASERDAALPVDHTRGRAKLFKTGPRGHGWEDRDRLYIG